MHELSEVVKISEISKREQDALIHAGEIMRAPDMTSVRISAYDVPNTDSMLPLFSCKPINSRSIFDVQETAPLKQVSNGYIWETKGKRYRWENGRWLQLQREREAIARRDLEKRLNNLRQVKLELEESNDRRKQIICHLTKRLDTANAAMYSKGEVYKHLYKSEERLKIARLRMKELGNKIEQVLTDNDRIQNTIDKFRDEYKCKGPCGKVRGYKCFPRDPRSVTGRDNRCNICQKNKTAQWRAAKKTITQ